MAVRFSILLLLITAGQALYLPGISLWLEWKKDYIARELCVNRFSPELMCSGRCYVQDVTSQALGQEDEDKAPAPVSQKEGQLLVMTLPPSAHLQLGMEGRAGAQLPAHALYAYALLLPLDFFHPPC
ncbi:MAG: hypothetical protein KDC66_16210 [Phaeodactylibacter sp.]|nr:hypothetical protein [Phaeodactylibacter sp.]